MVLCFFPIARLCVNSLYVSKARMPSMALVSKREHNTIGPKVNAPDETNRLLHKEKEQSQALLIMQELGRYSSSTNPRFCSWCIE